MVTKLLGMTWNHCRGYDPMAATSKVYAETHPGVSIVWEKRSLQAFADHPVDDLASKYDLIVVDHPHAGFVARDGCLVNLSLPERNAELDLLAQQSLGHSHESYQYNGQQWALAIDAATQVAAYRPDLIEKNQLPTTWDQVIELAQAGRVLWPLKPVDAVSSFNSLAANRGTPVDPNQQKLIRPEDGQAVLEAMGAVAQHLPEECFSMSPPEVLDWMSRTDNEQYAYCPLLYGYTNYSRDGYAERLLHFSDAPALGSNGPCGTQLGGTGIAVSAYCKHPEVAIDYAFWIAGAECQRTIFFDAGGQPANSAAWDDDHCNKMAHNFFRNTLATHDAAWIRPTDDGYLDYQDQGGERISQFLRIGANENCDSLVRDLNEICHSSMKGACAS